MLVGSRSARPGTAAAEVSATHWAHPVTGEPLREVGFEVPEQVGATFLGDAPFLDMLTTGVDALADDYPQRLMRTGRPAGGDPQRRFIGNDPELFREVIDAGRARNRFARSPFVDTRFSQQLKQDTLPYFERRSLVNHVMLAGADPLRDITQLHELLTRPDCSGGCRCGCSAAMTPSSASPNVQTVGSAGWSGRIRQWPARPGNPQLSGSGDQSC